MASRRSYYEGRITAPEPQEPDRPYYMAGFDRTSGTIGKYDKETGALIGFALVKEKKKD